MDSTIYKPRNEDVDIKIRRYQDALSLSGGMVIALTVWDIIKLYIGFFLGEDTIAGQINDIMNQGLALAVGTEYEAMTKVILWLVFMLIILVFSVVIFWYHYYIGINAFRAGRCIAKKPCKFYLVLTAFSAVFSALLIPINAIMSLFTGNNGGGVSLASLLIEVMAFTNYASILYATGMIKKLKEARGKAQ